MPSRIRRERREDLLEDSASLRRDFGSVDSSGCARQSRQWFVIASSRIREMSERSCVRRALRHRPQLSSSSFLSSLSGRGCCIGQHHYSPLNCLDEDCGAAIQLLRVTHDFDFFNGQMFTLCKEGVNDRGRNTARQKKHQHQRRGRAAGA